MNKILCPHCGNELEISEAIKHQIEKERLAEINAVHKKELEEMKKMTLIDAEKRAREEYDLKMKRAQDDIADREARNKKLLDQIEELDIERRKLKKESEEVVGKMQKKLEEEEEKIRADAQKKAEEEQHLKLLEKDKQLQDALKANEDMRRKLQQGSQQAQGEVFELEFETLLFQHYPNDKVVEVKKGVKGGDIIQEVWDARGNYVGRILWELKNTKTWSESWTEKLKTDRRTINADEAVLISEVMPSNIKTAGFREGIWVTGREFVFPLCDTLRAKLIQLYYVKNSVHAKDEKMEILYNYLSGTEFKHRVEAIIDAFSNMQEEIEKEKRYFSNKWARDEKNIRQVIDNTYGMHGDVKGIIGSMLPQIKGLDTLGLESGE